MSFPKSFIALMTVGFLLIAVLVMADVPQLVNYQGRLTNTDGSAVDDDTYFIKFKIYGSESGDDSLWSSGIQAVTVTGGLFNYQLGTIIQLPDDLFSDSTRYLGITVGADPEISPRVRMITAPYAYQALRSDSADYTDNSGNLNGQAASYYLAWSNLTGIPADIADGDDVDTDWNNLTNVPAGFADGTDDVGSSDWNDLTNVPPGFADGTDDVDTDWNNLTNVPADIADGDDVDTNWNSLINVPADIADGDDVDTNWNSLINVPADIADGDDVDTNWNSLINVPPGFADGVDDVGSSDWNDLTNVPPGFADGTDDVDTDWNNLTNVPADIANGDDVDTNWNSLINVPADIADGDDVDTNWNSLINVPAGFADGVDDNSGGDITGVTAGSGLSGGGASGSVNLYVGTGDITAIHIATDAVASSEIAADAVGWDEIAADAVGLSEIATNAVGSAEIIDNSILASDISTDGVTAAEIAAGAVGTSEIATNGVGAAEIAADAVGTSEIADGSVWSVDIANLSIINADISGTADIDPTKILRTAATVDPGSINYFNNTNYFNENVHLYRQFTVDDISSPGAYSQFYDSTMRIDSNGIRIGDPTSPSVSDLVHIERNFNIGLSRYGLDIYLTNAASGNLYGVYSRVERDGANSRTAVYGYADAVTSSAGLGISYGIRGSAYDGNTNYGIYGYAGAAGTSRYGVYGSAGGSTNNYGVYCFGNLHSTGSNTKGDGGYKIDHPQDPENKYLYHNDVSSPEMMNIYNGNITTDADGDAMVELPDYFESLNSDFRYQLAVVGTFAQAIISQRIANNNFSIKTDKPFVDVSWQVTGIRKDTFASSQRKSVEIDKSDSEKGLYMHPEAFGYGLEESINYENEKSNLLEPDEESEE